MLRSTLAALALAIPLLAAAQRRPDLQRGLVASYRLDGDAVDDVTRIPASAMGTRPVDGHDGVRERRALVRRRPRHGEPRRAAAARRASRSPRGSAPRSSTGPQVDRLEGAQPPRPLPEELRAAAQPGRPPLPVRAERRELGRESRAARRSPPGRWTHVTAIYDGARAQLFVDGAAGRRAARGPLRSRPPPRPSSARARRAAAATAAARRPHLPLRRRASTTCRIWDRALSGDELADRLGPRRRRRRAGPSAAPAYLRAARAAAVPRRPGRRRPRALVARYALDGDAREALGGADGALAGTRPAEDRGGHPRGALAFARQGPRRPRGADGARAVQPRGLDPPDAGRPGAGDLLEGVGRAGRAREAARARGSQSGRPLVLVRPEREPVAKSRRDRAAARLRPLDPRRRDLRR